MVLFTEPARGGVGAWIVAAESWLKCEATQLHKTLRFSKDGCGVYLMTHV